MSGAYGESDRDECIATVRAALDAGITVLDTGDFYAMGHNELLLAEALRPVPRETYQLSVKFGAQVDPAGAWVGYDARPAALKTAAAYSLQRLGTDYIDVYRPARLDPAVPIEDTIGAIGDLVDAGYVRHIGLSEVGSETIRRAASVRSISDLQIEYSLMTRGVESDILGTCRDLGIGVTAYGVLARGLIGGHWTNRAAAQVISALRVRVSPRPTWTATWHWSKRCARSPTSSGCRWRRRRSPGWTREAPTSCRWSARAPGLGWPRRSARWT